ncbi:hypothetical protein Enr13x_43700 [Stieleria neptunia]|uniref:Uncharacterized protein n=1 Tax=Stieleria neptunia TaxID=2527979 RepID=A0A518HUL1_9BACT|nr:hypothetical protein Enr13x_43700 [Stieleria neptunia]
MGQKNHLPIDATGSSSATTGGPVVHDRLAIVCHLLQQCGRTGEMSNKSPTEHFQPRDDFRVDFRIIIIGIFVGKARNGARPMQKRSENFAPRQVRIGSCFHSCAQPDGQETGPGWASDFAKSFRDQQPRPLTMFMLTNRVESVAKIIRAVGSLMCTRSSDHIVR